MESEYRPELSHFDLDRKRGEQGELFVSDICRMLADGSGRIEVKADFYFAGCGKRIPSQRFYVETECQGRDGVWRPSGINVTRSDIWAFVLGDLPATFIVETAWLKRAVDLARQNPLNFESCDYGENPTRGVFVYINHLIKTREIVA